MAFQQQDRSKELTSRLTHELDSILTAAYQQTRWQQRWLAFHLLFPLLLCAIVTAWSFTVTTDEGETLASVPSVLTVAPDRSWSVDSLGCSHLSDGPGAVLASRQPGNQPPAQKTKTPEPSFFESFSSAYLHSFEMRYCADQLKSRWMFQGAK